MGHEVGVLVSDRIEEMWSVVNMSSGSRCNGLWLALMSSLGEAKGVVANGEWVVLGIVLGVRLRAAAVVRVMPDLFV